MKIQMGLLLILLLTGSAFAEVSCDPASGALLIENCSVTPKTLAVTDKINDWGKVKKDQNGNFIIDADLRIGSNGTFSISQCEVTLNGDLVVMPYWIAGVSPEKNWRSAKVCRNRLEIGRGGVLKMYPGKRFMIGRDPAHEKAMSRGGEFTMEGGTLTAAAERWGGQAKIFVHPASPCILKDAVIEKFDGFFYGISPNCTIENCTFTDGDAVIVGSHEHISGCTFRNLKRAILDFGSLDAKFHRCKFENNGQNFILRYGPGVDLIDCDIQPGKKVDVLQMPKPDKKGRQITPAIRIFQTVDGKLVEKESRAAVQN